MDLTLIVGRRWESIALSAWTSMLARSKALIRVRVKVKVKVKVKVMVMVMVRVLGLGLGPGRLELSKLSAVLVSIQGIHSTVLCQGSRIGSCPSPFSPITN